MKQIFIEFPQKYCGVKIQDPFVFGFKVFPAPLKRFIRSVFQILRINNITTLQSIKSYWFFLEDERPDIVISEWQKNFSWLQIQAPRFI